MSGYDPKDAPDRIVINPLMLTSYGKECSWKEGDWNVPGLTLIDGVPYIRDDPKVIATSKADEINRLRDHFRWVLRNTSGRELRLMVGPLEDTSDLDEFIRAIEATRAKYPKD